MSGTAASGYHASDGAAYEVFLGRWTRRLAPLLVEFAAFPEEGDLLDVGCGAGSLAFAMASRWPGRRVVGIDRAPDGPRSLTATAWAVRGVVA